MKKVAVFVDINNQYQASRQTRPNSRINYQRYLEKLGSEFQLMRAFAYGAQMKDEALSFITALKNFGYEVKYRTAIRVGDRQDIRRTDRNMMMAIDIWRTIEQVDVVVIGSNDPELVPVVIRCKELGREVYIWSCHISRDLRDVCNRFYELDDTFFDVKKEVIAESAS